MGIGKQKYRLVDKVLISLPESEDRRNKFFSSPCSSGFRVFKAFDGRKDGKPGFFDSNRFSEINGRAPLPGETGCSISHYLAIKEFSERVGEDSDVLLVVEDDAKLPPHFNYVLNKLLKRITGLEYCVLAGGLSPSFKYSFSNRVFRELHLSLLAKPIISWRGPQVYRAGVARGEFWGTVAYVITRSAARKYVSYVDSVEKLGWLADQYNYWPAKMGIKAISLRPALADWDVESLIREDAHVPPELNRIPALSLLFANRRLFVNKIRGVLGLPKMTSCLGDCFYFIALLPG